MKGHTLRRSPNDIRYFHISDYLQSAHENEYEVVVMTDLFDVSFGQNPFDYLVNDKGMNQESKDLYIGCEVMPSQSILDWMKRRNGLKSGNWFNWVHDRLEGCFKKEVVDKCVKWIESEHAMPTNPGILAANRRTMTKYLDKMKSLLMRTNQ